MSNQSGTVVEPHLNVEMSVKVGQGFSAVAGMEEIKRTLRRDFVDVVSNRAFAKAYDITPPNMIFFGPPGTGKTFLTMRLAEECGMDVCTITPSDMGSIYIHGSQKLIQDLFMKAAEKAMINRRGCLLLIDEIDALCGKRDVQGREFYADEVAEWLTQLNDCVQRNVYVVGTTNCIDRIDKAIVRHGRIDKVVYIGLPDMECRKQIFELELKKRPCDKTIDTETLARMTEGYTSSDIPYVVKETAYRAFEETLNSKRRRLKCITEAMLEETIRATRSSVSPDEVRQYEKMREEYENNNAKVWRRIGFIA